MAIIRLLARIAEALEALVVESRRANDLAERMTIN